MRWRPTGFPPLPSVFGTHQLRERTTALRLNPLLNRNKRRFFVLQLFCDAGHEIRVTTRGLFRQERQHFCKTLAAYPRGADQTIGPEIRLFAEFLFPPDILSQLSNGFDDGEPKHNGKDPQLRNGKCRFLLILLNRFDQLLLGNRKIGSGRYLPGKFTYPKIAVGSRRSPERLLETVRHAAADFINAAL